jgi:hypothetical protein
MGEIEGQYGSRDDPKKLALIREIPENTGELVTFVPPALTVKNSAHCPHSVLML